VALKVVIDEGPKVKVDYIHFHGNKQYDDGDLKSEMKETNERKWWSFGQQINLIGKNIKKIKILSLRFTERMDFAMPKFFLTR